MKKFGKNLYLGLVLLFLYAPIIILILFSFNESKSRGTWTGFTFKWYAKLFSDPETMNALYVTLSMAVITAIVATLIGTVAAIGIHSMRKWPKALCMNVSYLPILNPEIVTAVSLMILFVFAKLDLGYFTMLLGHITFSIPYVILSIMPKLQQMNKHSYEAAMDLGCTPVQAVRKVILPEIMPGVITGAIMAFTLSLDDFVISFFTSSGVKNLSVHIYSMARRGIDPQINALSALMFVAVLLLLIIVNVRTARDAKKQNKNGGVMD